MLLYLYYLKNYCSDIFLFIKLNALHAYVMLIMRTEMKQNFMNSIKIKIFHLAFNMPLRFTNMHTQHVEYSTKYIFFFK